MEFKEFTNPEEKDYDINSSIINSNKNESINPYFEQLISLIGILEDVTDQELQELYGISLNEYYNPSQETIIKVSEKISGRHM